MQSQNPMIADFVKLANSAAGTLAGMGREARDAARERAILKLRAPGLPEALSAQVVAFVQKLREGDYFSDGKLHDCDGKEVPVVVEDDHGHGAPEHRPVQIKSREHV